MLVSLLACAFGGPEGDLWLEIEEGGPGQDRVMLYLPVSDLREAGEPAVLHTAQGDVDLRAEARALRAGAERTWTSSGGERLTLANVVPAGTPATTFAIAIGGPKGGGLEATLPLDGASADQVNAELGGSLDASVDGVDLKLDDDACAQLRRSPPVLLAEIVGPKGNGLRIRTR